MKNTQNRNKIGLRTSALGFFTNLLLSLGKITVGVISGSIAVLADGLNNLGDGASSAVSLISFKLSERPADKKHPFGHARYEYVAGLVIAIIIVTIAIELLVSSVREIIQPSAVEISNAVFVVLGVSIVVKLGLFVFYTIVNGRIKSSAVKASALDSLCDVLVTTAVLTSAIITKFSGFNPDGIASVLVGCFVLFSGIKMLKETLSQILGEQAPPELIKAIKDAVLSYPEIKGVHGMLAHNYGPNKYYVSLHVEIDGDANFSNTHNLVDSIEKALKTDFRIEVVIHADPADTLSV